MSIRERVNAKGQKVWVVSIHQEGRAILRRTLRTLKEARSFEKRALTLLDSTGSIEGLKARNITKRQCALNSLYQQALSHPKGWKYASNAQPVNAEQVIAFLGAARSALTITNDDLMDLINHCLKARSNNPKTVNKKLYALQTLFDVGLAQGLYQAEDVINAKEFVLKEDQGGRTRILSDDEIQQFETELLNLEAEPRTYFATLLHMGMRPQELWALRGEDFNAKTMSLRILRGKKRGACNESHLPIPKNIQEFWECQNSKKPKLFETIHNNHQSLALMQRIKQRMGIDDYHLPATERLTPYTLRHTCCTRMIRAGIPIYTVKEWMGHNSIETTLKYAHFSPQMFTSALETLERFSSS